MSNHIPTLLLTQFVAGELEEPAAVALAKHLDTCSQCAAAAAAADPLASVFASTKDPVVPEGLEAAIQSAAIEAGPPTAQPEERDANMGVFLLAAAFLLAVIISPMGVVEGGNQLLTGVANRGTSLLGRQGSMGLGGWIAAGLILAGLVGVAIRWKRSR
jgi:anti-sigma factor RsiW